LHFSGKIGQGNRLVSRFQLLHECKHTYINAFGSKKTVWQMYDDSPQPRVLNFISNNGLTIYFFRKSLWNRLAHIDNNDASRCYLSSTYVIYIGLHVKEITHIISLEERHSPSFALIYRPNP
jgi:hypothetical protein